jgi:hypothetical protein
MMASYQLNYIRKTAKILTYLIALLKHLVTQLSLINFLNVTLNPYNNEI